ncbi:MAG: divalent metal cation transporter [Actinomycetota bacterium]
MYKRRRHIRDYFILAKDGVITGAADNDPSGIVTYIQVGALTQYALLWLIPLTLPMLIVVEDMSARVGVITKKGLNTVIENHYGRTVAVIVMVLVVIANTATLGADMAGMAAVIQLFTGVHFLWFLLPIGLLFLWVLLKEGYAKVSRVLYFITPILLVYVVTVFLTNPNWGEIAKATFLPTAQLKPTFLSAAVALLGTTISAYLLFWQTNEEIEEKKTLAELKDESLGVRIGMIYTSLIFFFIVLTGAIVLYGHVGNVNSWTAADAALALKPLAGQASYLLFTIGVIGSGLIAVPVLALTTSYVVSDTFRWNESLRDKPATARGFYVVLTLSLMIGAALSLAGVKPMAMLFYSQVLQGIVTPFLVIALVLVSNNRDVMGENTNGFWANLVGWATVATMIVFSALLLWQTFF